MGKTERFRAEADGWSVGNADAFLGLSADESTYIEVKWALAGLMVERRKAASLTQAVMTRQAKSSR